MKPDSILSGIIAKLLDFLSFHPFFRYSFILSEINYKTLLYKKNKKAYNSFIIYFIKEGKKTENKDKKNITRKKIINYVLNNHVTSKAEIAKELNLSMPTVLANVNDLLEKMVLEETGEYASTGGRKQSERADFSI